MTAVYGGSNSLTKGIVSVYMFGNTHAIYGYDMAVSNRLQDRDFVEYLRWEYRPADRASVLLAARRGAPRAPRGSRPSPWSFLRRIRVWAKVRRDRAAARVAAPPEPIHE